MTVIIWLVVVNSCCAYTQNGHLLLYLVWSSRSLSLLLLPQWQWEFYESFFFAFSLSPARSLCVQGISYVFVLYAPNVHIRIRLKRTFYSLLNSVHGPLINSLSLVNYFDFFFISFNCFSFYLIYSIQNIQLSKKIQLFFFFFCCSLL